MRPTDPPASLEPAPPHAPAHLSAGPPLPPNHLPVAVSAAQQLPPSTVQRDDRERSDFEGGGGGVQETLVVAHVEVNVVHCSQM
jgi:hypothetical protein